MFKELVATAREEWFLAISIGSCAIVLMVETYRPDTFSTTPGLAVLFLWLFTVVLGSGMSVVRHADRLAIYWGEPYGTLILTLAATIIEVISISAMLIHSAPNPALVRDTIFAVVMILLNGMVGFSLLLGGWLYREQQYNLQGANTYLGVIIPLTVLSLVLPNYTTSAPGPAMSPAQEIFVSLVSIGLYAAFLIVQTIRHRSYFMSGDPAEAADETPNGRTRHPAFHLSMLVSFMLPLVFLAEKLAQPVDTLLETFRAPTALGGTVIAVLVATPEALVALRAAARNHLQRSMNIFLGSVLATIGLTIPAMIAFNQLSGQNIVLGLENSSVVLLLLTLVVSLVTFSSYRTTVLQGAVHLVLFGTYILLIFDG